MTYVISSYGDQIGVGNVVLQFWFPADGSYISVDPTFNLGPFFVTPVTYRNPLVCNKRTGSKAAFCGPLLIHFRKTTETYYKLFECINNLVPNLRGINGYGTDGEAALVGALERAYPNARALRCCHHFLNNAGEKVSAEQKLMFQTDIKRVLLTPMGEFEEGFDSLIATYPLAAGFLTCNKEVMKCNLHSSRNGGELFYTNESESINAKIKKFCQYKGSTLIQFLNLMKEFFGAENGAAIDAITGHSATYIPSKEFIDAFGNKDWNTLSRKEKQGLIKSFQSFEPMYAVQQTSCSTDFDVNPENCHINVASEVLRNIFAKADGMIKENQVMPAPSVDASARMYSCCSKSDTANHHVKIKDSYEVTCQCQGFKIYKICSHAVAAAHVNCTLFDFIMWHRNKYKTSAVSTAVLTRTVNTTNAGKKGHERKRVRLRTKNTVIECTGNGSQAKEECHVDHKTVARLCYTANHTTNTKCCVCEKPMSKENPNGVSIGKYDYRSYRSHRGKKQYVMSFKKQWAYAHLYCYTSEQKIHLCAQPSASVLDELRLHKIPMD